MDATSHPSQERKVLTGKALPDCAESADAGAQHQGMRYLPLCRMGKRKAQSYQQKQPQAL